jgi:tetratricopeptide (TPR) repeat protein
MTRIRTTPTTTVLGVLSVLWLLQPGLASLPRAVAGDEVEWRSDYATARREAADKDRPLLLDFGTTQCYWCKRLDSVTFRDGNVAQLLNGQFVPLKVDAHREAVLAEKLRIQAYPTIVLASPEGKILDVIEGFKEAAPLQERLHRALTLVSNPEWMQRDYQEAGKAIGTSDYARAIALLKNLTQDGKERPIQVKSRQLLADLEQQSAGRLARAKQLADKGETTEAIDTVTELIRVYAGTQAATEGAHMLTALANRPEIQSTQRTRRARDLLAQAREDFRTKQFVGCLNRCDTLCSTYADLPEGSEAQQIAAEIKSNPEYLQKACDSLNTQLGVLYLTMAETWIKKGQPQQAVACLERLIQTMPGTRHAETAQVRLAQIQGGSSMRTVEFKKQEP